MKYAGMQLKMILRFLPKAALVSVVLFAAVFILFSSFSDDARSGEEYSVINVGVVGETDETFLGFGIGVIQAMDSSSSIVNMQNMTEADAKFKLQNGGISAYMVIPDGFLSSVTHGEVKQIDYVTYDTTGGIGTVLKEELLHAVSVMLVHSQKGVYAMQNAVISRGIRENLGKNTDELNLKYFSLILNRPDAIDVKVDGVSNGLSLAEYLLCGLSVLWLSLGGIAFCPLYVKKDHSLGRMLRRGGCGAFEQTLSEFAAFYFGSLAQLAAVLALAFLGRSTVSDALGDSIPIASEITLFGMAKLFVYLCIPVLMICALQFFAFMLCDNAVSGIALQFFGAVCLCYVGGCMYPSDFLPDVVSTIGNALPVGVAREYLCHLMNGNAMNITVLFIAAYSALLIGASAFVRRIRLNNI